MTVVHVEEVEAFVMKLACIDNLVEENIFLMQIDLYFLQYLRILYGLECVVGKRNLRVLQILRGVVIHEIQLSIAPFVTLVESKDLFGMEDAEEAIGMCGLILASLLIRVQGLFPCEG